MHACRHLKAIGELYFQWHSRRITHT
ncbi:hypothetical protein CSPAE12_01755 [Colletotrichum incanum]|nr:hypothetical protein CSPAE12_01755 [Colletotrichum incanum]